MATGHDTRDDPDLETLFAAARSSQMVPSAALMARVLNDADAVQAAGRRQTVVVPAPVSPFAALALLVRAIGGGGALAGLATATLAGFWIGLAQPAALTTFSERLWSAEAADAVELIPTFDEVLSDADG